MFYRHKHENLKMEHGIKCQAYSLISVVHDEYLINNGALKVENNKLKQELENIKSQQLKLAKPFVDLTQFDDDSDVEIIEVHAKVPAPICDKTSQSIATAAEVIELDEDGDNETEEKGIPKAEQVPVPPVTQEEGGFFFKNTAAIDDALNEVRRFENFLFDQN